MFTRFLSIRDLLRNNPAARELFDRREREAGLLEQVRSLLPEAMRAHCLDADITRNRLTIFLDSPAWATRARFLAQDITTSLKEWQISDMHVQVRLNGGEVFTPPPQAVIQAPRLTAGAVQHLLEAADQMHDPELSRVIRNFAQRHLHLARREDS